MSSASSPVPAAAGPPEAPAVARLRSPGELAAVVPLLCGFVPTESLVVVALHGPRSRIGLTLRIDLPDAGGQEGFVEDVLERLAVEDAGGALLAVYTELPEPADVPRGALVAALTAGCRRAGMLVADALLVRDGRWWSYLCREPSCCPSGGTPLDPQAGDVALVAAERVLRGRAVLPSRAALCASVLAPQGPRAEAARRALAGARRQRASSRRESGRAATGRGDLALWRHAVSDPGGVSAADDVTAAAALVASLDDVLVRDAVLTWALEDDGSDLLTVLLWLAGSCGPPDDAGVCTALGWVAHIRGDGALANVALDRALSSDPAYAMARLSRQALDTQVPPARIRALLAQSRGLLHRQHPWTAEPAPERRPPGG